MERSTEKDADEGSRSRSTSNTAGSRRGAPLVIVSERGRHSDESRRIVRAQAARASAAQSRVTRARNREEREGTVRESPQSPGLVEQAQFLESPTTEPSGNPVGDFIQKPLVQWLSSVLQTPPTGLLAQASTSLSGGATNLFSSGSGLVSAFGSAAGLGQSTLDITRPQLPRAVPRGFATLQQRLQISDTFILLLSRDILL